MKFLVDANVRYSVGNFLQSQGHDVQYIAGTAQHDLSDDKILAIAKQNSCIILTNDKDFGHLVFYRNLPHSGIVLFRLSDESRDSYFRHMTALLELYGERLQNHFVVVMDDHVRYR